MKFYVFANFNTYVIIYSLKIAQLGKLLIPFLLELKIHGQKYLVAHFFLYLVHLLIFISFTFFLNIMHIN